MHFCFFVCINFFIFKIENLNSLTFTYNFKPFLSKTNFKDTFDVKTVSKIDFYQDTRSKQWIVLKFLCYHEVQFHFISQSNPLNNINIISISYYYFYSPKRTMDSDFLIFELINLLFLKREILEIKWF